MIEAANQYVNTGNREFYTAANLKKRRELRYHPMVKDALKSFWDLMATELDLQDEEMGKKAYYHEYRKTRQALAPEMPEDLFEQSMLMDWFADCSNRPEPGSSKQLGRTQFHDSIFELADLWTWSLDPAEYASFISMLEEHNGAEYREARRRREEEARRAEEEAERQRELARQRAIDEENRRIREAQEAEERARREAEEEAERLRQAAAAAAAIAVADAASPTGRKPSVVEWRPDTPEPSIPSESEPEESLPGTRVPTPPGSIGRPPSSQPGEEVEEIPPASPAPALDLIDERYASDLLDAALVAMSRRVLGLAFNRVRCSSSERNKGKDATDRGLQLWRKLMLRRALRYLKPQKHQKLQKPETPPLPVPETVSQDRERILMSREDSASADYEFNNIPQDVAQDSGEDDVLVKRRAAWKIIHKVLLHYAQFCWSRMQENVRNWWSNWDDMRREKLVQVLRNRALIPMFMALVWWKFQQEVDLEAARNARIAEEERLRKEQELLARQMAFEHQQRMEAERQAELERRRRLEEEERMKREAKEKLRRQAEARRRAEEEAKLAALERERQKVQDAERRRRELQQQKEREAREAAEARQKRLEAEKRAREQLQREKDNCKREREAMRKEELLARQAAALEAARLAELERAKQLRSWMNSRSSGAGNLNRALMTATELLKLADRHQANQLLSEVELRTFGLGTHHTDFVNWLLSDRSKLFKFFDEDHDGALSLNELATAATVFQQWQDAQPEPPASASKDEASSKELLAPSDFTRDVQGLIGQFAIPDSPLIIPFHRTDGLKNTLRSAVKTPPLQETNWNTDDSISPRRAPWKKGEVAMDQLSHDGSLWTQGYSAYNWDDPSQFAGTTGRVASDLNEASCLLAQENGGSVVLDDSSDLNSMPPNTVAATQLNSIFVELARMSSRPETVEGFCDALVGCPYEKFGAWLLKHCKDEPLSHILLTKAMSQYQLSKKRSESRASSRAASRRASRTIGGEASGSRATSRAMSRGKPPNRTAEFDLALESPSSRCRTAAPTLQSIPTTIPELRPSPGQRPTPERCSTSPTKWRQAEPETPEDHRTRLLMALTDLGPPSELPKLMAQHVFRSADRMKTNKSITVVELQTFLHRRGPFLPFYCWLMADNMREFRDHDVNRNGALTISEVEAACRQFLLQLSNGIVEMPDSRKPNLPASPWKELYYPPAVEGPEIKNLAEFGLGYPESWSPTLSRQGTRAARLRPRCSTPACRTPMPMSPAPIISCPQNPKPLNGNELHIGRSPDLDFESTSVSTPLKPLITSPGETPKQTCTVSLRRGSTSATTPPFDKGGRSVLPAATTLPSRPAFTVTHQIIATSDEW